MAADVRWTHSVPGALRNVDHDRVLVEGTNFTTFLGGDARPFALYIKLLASWYGSR